MLHVLTDTDVIKSMLQPIIFAIGAAIALIFTLRINRNNVRQLEVSAFDGECIDIIRHYEANIKVINKILEEKKNNEHIYPFRSIHLQRLCVLPETIKFSPDLYKNLPYFEVTRIHQHKLMIRNIELDIAEALRIYKEETDESMYSFLEFLIERFEAAIENVTRTLKRQSYKQSDIDIARTQSLRPTVSPSSDLPTGSINP